MPIKDIRKFIDLCADGDNDFKCWYYQTAIEAGTEKIHAGKSKVVSA